jgi:hypothetical protein
VHRIDFHEIRLLGVTLHRVSDNEFIRDFVLHAQGNDRIHIARDRHTIKLIDIFEGSCGLRNAFFDSLLLFLLTWQFL